MKKAEWPKRVCVDVADVSYAVSARFSDILGMTRLFKLVPRTAKRKKNIVLV